MMSEFLFHKEIFMFIIINDLEIKLEGGDGLLFFIENLKEAY